MPDTVFRVTNAAELAAALRAIANGRGNYVIEIGSAGNPAHISLGGDLPIIALAAATSTLPAGSLTIIGNGSEIDGNNQFRGLLAYSGQTVIRDLTFVDTVAIGGDGGNSSNASGTGGGGAGLGGGLFVGAQAQVSISNVDFVDTGAIGGNGGRNPYGATGSGGAGGGGMGGDGGTPSLFFAGTRSDRSGGAGGGGLGVGADGASGGITSGGAGIGTGQGSGGSGGTQSRDAYLLFYTNTLNYSAASPGADGGGGGAGYVIGGGGGGIGGANVGNQYLGGFGFDLTFSGPGAALQLLVLAGAISPGIGTAGAVAWGIYSYLSPRLGAPAEITYYSNLTLTNAGGFGTEGTGVPTPRVPSYGLGVSFRNSGGDAVEPPGGSGGFGGGGGGGGQNSSGGDGGFGGGGGGAGRNAGPNANYLVYAGDGGFGGGAGGGYYLVQQDGSQILYGAGRRGNGGGAAYGSYGGGGLGAGGAVFVQTGGTLIDLGGSDIVSSRVAGGLNGANAAQGADYLRQIALTSGNSPQSARIFDGSAYGSGIFLQGQTRLALVPDAGTTIHTGNIWDEAGSPDEFGRLPFNVLVNGIAVFAGAVQVGGSGTVVLGGTNRYLGGTLLAADVLNPLPGFNDPASANYGRYPVGGSTLEIATGATLLGTIRMPGVTLAGNQDLAAARLVLDAGVTLGNPIQIDNVAGADAPGRQATSGGTRVEFNATPLVIDLSAGGRFTGSFIGLLPQQRVAVIGAPFVNAPVRADESGFLVYVQGYVDGSGHATNAAGGTLASLTSLSVAGSTEYWIASGSQLQGLLQWLPAFNPLADTNYTVNLNGQIGSSLTLPSFLVPTIASGSRITLANEGRAYDGIANPAHDTVTLSGGAITLNPLTALTLSGDLVINNLINGSGGASGLTTQGNVRLTASNRFLGGVTLAGTLELANARAAGEGTITFAAPQFVSPANTLRPTLFGATITAGNRLVLDGATLPTNRVANFEFGNTVSVRGIADTAALRFADANGDLRVGDQVLHIAGPRAANARYMLTADGQGGTIIETLQRYGDNLLLDEFVNLAARAGALGMPAGAELVFDAAGSLSPNLSTDRLPAIVAPDGYRIVIDGAGRQLIRPVGVTTTPVVDHGEVVLRDLTFANFASGRGITVNDQARVYLETITNPDGATIASGGLLVLRSGTLGGSVDNRGVFSVAPFAGDTAMLSGAVVGDLTIGDRSATLFGVPTLGTGTVIVTPDATVTGRVILTTPQTLELAAGARLNGAEIAFANAVGGVVRIDGTTLPTNTINFVDDIGTIQFADLHPASSVTLVVDADGRLTVPGLTGTLQFAGLVQAGEQFRLIPVGEAGALLIQLDQHTTIDNALDFAALGAVLSALPGAQGLGIDVALSGQVVLDRDTPVFDVRPGVLLRFTDAGPSTPGGLVLADGVRASIDGNNRFTGGITLGDRSVLTIYDGAAAGTGGIRFDGDGATLRVAIADGTVDSITGFGPSEFIDIATGAVPVGGTLTLDLDSRARIATATGYVTIVLPDQTPGSLLSAVADGNGGVRLSTAFASQTITVHDAAELDAAIVNANTSARNTTIVLAPPAGTIAIDRALTAINLIPGASLFVEGGGAILDGGGQWSGFSVRRGNFAVADLSLQNIAGSGGGALQIVGPSTVRVGGDGSFEGAVSGASGSVLELDAATGDDQLVTGAITGNVTVRLAGEGNVTLSGPLGYGVTDIRGGTLTINSALDGLRGGIVDNGTLQLGSSASGTFAQAISGTGRLISDSASVITLAGGLTSTGNVTINAGTLRIGGTGLTAPIVNAATLDLFTSGIVTSSISGTGSFIYSGTGTTRLAAANGSNGSLTVRSGVLDLASTNSFSAVTLEGGELRIGSGATTGSSAINFAPGGRATLTVDVSQIDDVTIAGFRPGSVIHLLGVPNPQSVTADGHQLTVTGRDGSNPVSFAIQLDDGTDTSNAVYRIVSDGSSGAYLTQPSADYVIATATDLTSAIAAITEGGAAYQAGIDYSFSLTGAAIRLAAPLAPIVLAPDATLTINGALSIADPAARYVAGGGFAAAATPSALTIASPGVTINAGENPVSLLGVSLHVASSGELLILQRGGQAGQLAAATSVVDGTLTIDGDFTFGAPAGNNNLALTGSGIVTLQNGVFTLGDGNRSGSNPGLAIDGVLNLRSATLNAQGLSQFNGGRIHELNLFGDSIARVDLGSVSRLVFEPGGTSVVWNASSRAPTAILSGIDAGDRIGDPVIRYAQVARDGHVLHIVGSSGERVDYQIDPNDDISDIGFVISGGMLRAVQARYVVANEAELVAAIRAISAGGEAYGSGIDYTIVLAGDIALTQSLPNFALAGAFRDFTPASTVTVEGAGHAIDAAGHGGFESNARITLRNITVTGAGNQSLDGALTLTGNATAVLENAAIVDGAGPASGTVRAAVSGGTIVATPAAGQEVLIGDPITSGGLILNGAGTLRLGNASNSFTGGIRLDQGTLELSGSQSAGLGQRPVNVTTPFYGVGTAAVTFGGNAVIEADGRLPNIAVFNLGTGNGTLHFTAIAPEDLTLTRGRLVTTYYIAEHTAITARGDTGTVYLNGVTAPLTVISDGAGGSYVYLPRTQFTVADAAGLTRTIDAINVGGTQAAAGIADHIDLTPVGGTLAFGQSPIVVDLPTGTGLTIDGQGNALAGQGGTGFVLVRGSLAIEDVTIGGFGGSGAISLAAGTSASLTDVHFAAPGDDTSLLTIGDDARVTMIGGDASGGVVLLGDDAVLTLSAVNGVLDFSASIRDATGSGAGDDDGHVVTRGNVRLGAINTFAGGISVDGTLELGSVAAAGSGTINLSGASRLVIQPGVAVANRIAGLASGATIDVRGFDASSARIDGQIVTLIGASGSYQLNLADSARVTSAFTDVLSLRPDGDGGTIVSLVPRQTAGAAVSTTSISLGAAHATVLAGQPVVAPAADIRISNLAASGGETITAAFATLGVGVRGAGSLALAPGESGILSIGVEPTRPDGATGVFSGTATLALASTGPGRPDAPITVAPVTVTATYYDFARPILSRTAIDLGAARVGDAALTASLGIANGVGASAYREGLSYTLTETNPALTTTGPTGTLAAGQSATIGFSYSTQTAGIINDAALLGAVSTGAGTSNLADTSLGSQAIRLSGTVYNPAVAQLPTALSFGFVHVGDDVSRTLAVRNGAAIDAPSDSLLASFLPNGTIAGDPSQVVLGAGGRITGSSATIDVDAGSSDALTVRLNTASTGNFAALATVNLASHNGVLNDLSLPSQTVSISGTVLNYASAALQLVDGSPATLTGSGTAYTLDFGAIDSVTRASLSLRNSATGLSDLLSGYFTVTGSTAPSNFVTTGFDPFAGLAAGQSTSLPTITITPNQAGQVSQTIVLTPTGSNAGGYVGQLPAITLTVRAQVTVTAYTATTAAELATIVSEINAGGVNAQENRHYTIELAPAAGNRIDVTSALPAINLASGSSLTLRSPTGDVRLVGDGSLAGLSVTSGSVQFDGVSLSGFQASANRGAAITVGSNGSVSILSGSFDGGSGTAIALQGGSLVLNPLGDRAITIGGVSGGAVVHGGSGTATLTGTSAYDGGSVVAGNLVLATMDSAGSGTITLRPQSMLTLDATGNLAAPVAGFAGAAIHFRGVQNGDVTLEGNRLTVSDGVHTAVVTLADSNLSYYGLTIERSDAGTIVREAAPGLAPRGAAVASVDPVVFGNVHVGETATALLHVANNARQGGDTLVGNSSSGTAPFQVTGDLAVAPGRTGTVAVSFVPGEAGRYEGSVPLAFESRGANGASDPLSGTSVAISGNAYRLATPTISGLGNLGFARVGDTLSGTLTIANGVASPYQESALYAAMVRATGSTPQAATAAVTLSDSASGTVASGGSTTVGVSITPTSGGRYSFAVPVAFTSTGVGTSELADTPLAGQEQSLSAIFYAPAVAQYTGTVDFGWLHRGEARQGVVFVANRPTVAGEFIDRLSAAWTSVGRAFTASGSVTDQAVGDPTVALRIGFDAATTGVFNQSATLTFTSRNDVLPDLTTVGTPVALNAVVTDYARSALTMVSGSGQFAGQSSNNDLGNQARFGAYTLDLGSITGPQALSFRVANAATGFADRLSGTVVLGNGNVGALSGAGLVFGGLEAGQASDVFTVTIDPDQAGHFVQTVIVRGTGSNDGGYSGDIYDTTLTITGTLTVGDYRFPGDVTNIRELNDALATVFNGNAGPLGSFAGGLTNVNYVARFAEQGRLNFSDDIAPIETPGSSTLLLDGQGATINGGGHGGFWVTQTRAVELRDISLSNMGAAPQAPPRRRRRAERRHAVRQSWGRVGYAERRLLPRQRPGPR